MDKDVKKKKDIVVQMVDAIAGPTEHVNLSDDKQKEKYEEARRKLERRALEYLMFLED